MTEPKVRFKRDDGGSFPEWQTIPMSEVFTEITEKNHPEMPVLSVQQGVGTVLRDSSDRNILYDKSNLKGYKAMKKDDYIIHLRSFEGGLECSNYDGISSPAYRILRPQTILPATFRDYFRSHEFIHNKLAVSVVGIRDGKNIDMDTFWQIPMTVPCIEEQRKIADFLSSVDDVITASEQEIANLETQKKAVMKKIFSQEVRFKREDGTDFPEWDRTTLDNSCEYRRGSFPQPYGLEEWYDESKGMPFIQVADVNENMSINSDTKRHISDLAKAMSVFAPKGTLIITLQGTIGKVAITDYDAYIDRTLLLFQRVSEKLVLEYFKYALYMCFDEEKKKADGGIIKTITKDTLGSFVIPIPCIEEQRLIASFLYDFDTMILEAKKEQELWEKLKKGLLQQMFVA